MSVVTESRRQGGWRTAAVPHSAKPVVSVVTAVYNGAEHLAKTIESIREQQSEHYPTEHIVIDGGSTDGTLAILQKYDKSLAYWLSEADSGVYDAWNKGMAASRGEWIAFVGSDDAYRPAALKSYMEYIDASDGDLDYVSSRVEVVGARGLRVIGQRWRWRKFAEYMNVAHVGSLHRRRLFERLGPFDTSYRITGDYELLLRAGQGLRAGFLDQVTATMRAGGISDSGESVREAMRAKIETGGRNPLRAYVERYFALTKFQIRRSLSA